MPFPPPLLEDLACRAKENIHNPFLPTNWQKTGSEKAWRMPVPPELLVFISSNVAGEGKEEEQQGHRACYIVVLHALVLHISSPSSEEDGDL